MSYTPHNFKVGDTIRSSDANAIEDELVRLNSIIDILESEFGEINGRYLQRIEFDPVLQATFRHDIDISELKFEDTRIRKIIDMISKDNKQICDYDDIILSINHRGYNTIAPENTLPAYQLSAQKGFKYVECDVAFTSDGVPVLLHDETINRTSNGTGNVKDKTLAELKALDFGSWKSSAYIGVQIPTFEEFLVLCRNLGLNAVVELKETATYTQTEINKIVEIVKQTGMIDRCMFISFTFNYVKMLVDTYPADTALLVHGQLTNSHLASARQLKKDNNHVWLAPRWDYATESVCKTALDEGIKTYIWTFNDESGILGLPPYILGVTSDSINAGKVLYDATIKASFAEGDYESSKIIEYAFDSVDGNKIANIAGQSEYDAIITAQNYTVSDGHLTLRNGGYVDIPLAITSGKPITIMMNIDQYTVGSASYSRFFRGDRDVPSAFYNKVRDGVQFKTTERGLGVAGSVQVVKYFDSNVMKVANAANATISYPDFPTGQLAFVFDPNVDVKIYINGNLVAVTPYASNFDSTYAPTHIYIGDNESVSVMNTITYSKVKVFEKALTQAQILREMGV